MKILVLKHEEQYGPYELNDLEAYVAQGSFSLSDMCWQEGWTEWKPLSSIISRPPPPPAMSNPAVSSAQLNTRQEETVFSDGNILITTTRVIIQGTTYALRNITSVKATIQPAKKVGPILLLIVSIFLFFWCRIPATDESGSTAIFRVVSFFGSIVMFVRSVRSLTTLKPSYHLAIASSSGEVNALTSNDREYVKKVVSYINEAIVRYQ
jgi:hypothetical protein